MFKCQECSKKFKTVSAAEKAMNGDRGCPGCGGVDIDLDSEIQTAVALQSRRTNYEPKKDSLHPEGL